MAENSLFAILLRKPWWVSMAIAAGVALVARLLLPERFVVPGMLGGLPFLVIAGIASWRQRGLPSAAQNEQWLQRLRTMNARDFSAAVEAAYRHQGYEVQPIKSPGAELALRKYGQTTIRVTTPELRNLRSSTGWPIFRSSATSSAASTQAVPGAGISVVALSGPSGASATRTLPRRG